MVTRIGPWARVPRSVTRTARAHRMRPPAARAVPFLRELVTPRARHPPLSHVAGLLGMAGLVAKAPCRQIPPRQAKPAHRTLCIHTPRVIDLSRVAGLLGMAGLVAKAPCPQSHPCRLSQRTAFPAVRHPLFPISITPPPPAGHRPVR